jgi:glycosyltransferase involved in cell wall biosynthesis
MADPSDNPLVTVVCSTFNSKTTLRCALRSVLNHDFTNFEVRVMGDCCSDGSERIISELNDLRLHWFNFAKNTGNQSEPNNEGMRRARGKYIAFIGHDDLWMPWHLSRLVRHIEETGADFVHDLVANITPEGVHGVYGPPHQRSNYARTYFPTMSWLHRRALPDEIGFWRNADELGWQIDFDFSQRAARAGKKISFLPSLGGLKFHSAMWRIYARPGIPPQEEWLGKVLSDPKRLNEKILTQLATQYGQSFQMHDRRPPSGLALDRWADASKELLKAFFRDLIYLYGAERWPIKKLAARRLRRLRSKQRVVRGLRSLEDSGL